MVTRIRRDVEHIGKYAHNAETCDGQDSKDHGATSEDQGGQSLTVDL
jgi:hypothetical protein